MNLNVIRPKNEAEDLLLSKTKNCETLIEQTDRKAEGTLKFKMIQSKQTFHFKPPIPIEGSWMIGLTDLEVYKSIFNITEENNKFELYNFPDQKIGGVSYTKVRVEIKGDLDISKITATDLQDDLIGPTIIDEYREQLTKRKEDGAYMSILSLYRGSVFQDFENYLRTEIDLVQDDIRLVLYKYNSSFFTYDLQPGIYTFKDLSEALCNILQLQFPSSNNGIAVELDDITRKTKLVVKSGIIALRFDEKSFFNSILGFTSGWYYKHHNEYTSQKISNLSTTNEIHLKSDVIDGSVVNGLSQPILYSFLLDKTVGYKVFSQLEKVHFKKIKKIILNTKTFYLEDDNAEEVDFNQETLTFTLQMIKIGTIK